MNYLEQPPVGVSQSVAETRMHHKLRENTSRIIDILNQFMCHKTANVADHKR